LISDTVGFIKKLPHDLVASFRSTLDEALAASLLLFTVDASDPSFRSQLEVTQSVLAEIGADQSTRVMVLNKTDCLTADAIAQLSEEFPDALFISTRNPDDVARVRAYIRDFFERGMTEKKILIPYTQGRVLGMIRERAKVLAELHEEEGTIVTLKAHDDVYAWIEKQLS
jgi:GTPase